MMKFTKYIIACIAMAMLLSSCGGGVGLTKLGIDDLKSYKVEKLGLGWVEGTVVVDVYNGNKKNVIFESGRIELMRDDKTLAVATLQESVDLQSGLRRVDVPVRIRFKMDQVMEIFKLFSQKEQTKRDEKLAVKCSFDISRDQNHKSVRFNRKLSDKMLESIGERYGNLFDFNR